MAGPTRTLLSRFARRDDGSVSVLSVVFGACLIASLALSVDLGHVYLVRRENQGALDLAALSAARNLLLAESAARATLADNRIPSPESLTVTLGRYAADSSSDPTARFVAGGKPANAVRLELKTKPALFFGRPILGGSPTVTTAATAVNTRLASFTIGSRLASLQGGIANALLSKLTGASVSLSVMDYNALADAKIELPAMLSALATRARLTAATYDDVLNASVTTGDLINAIGDAAASTSGVKLLLQPLAQASARKIALSGLIDFGPVGRVKLGDPLGLGASASVLQTLTAALGVANGANQIDLDLGAQIPGLLALTASLTIGERPQSSPWFALNDEGATVRTAQTRLRLSAKVGGVLGLASLNLPVAVDVAASEATLSAAQCGKQPRTDATATLAVKPSVGRIWIGEPRNLSRWNDMSQAADVGPAAIADTLLLSATASAYVGVEQTQAINVPFASSEMAAGTVKTVSTTTVTQSALASLTRNLAISIDLKLLGLTLGTPKFVGDTLGRTLSPVGALLDPALDTVLRLLGVRVGEADVSVRGVRCDGSALVG